MPAHGSTDSFLDGNAAAGVLREVFAVDVTSAHGQCVGCGNTAPMAEARLFADAPGLVLRCRAATRCCCGWSAVAAGAGSTCAAWPTSSSPTTEPHARSAT